MELVIMETLIISAFKKISHVQNFSERHPLEVYDLMLVKLKIW